MSVATARAAIVETLLTIPELAEVYGWPQQNANVPMAHVLLDTVDPDFVLDSDKGRYRFIVRLFVGNANEADMTDLLDAFIAPSGMTVRGVINDDPTLGGEVDSCRVVDVQNFYNYPIGSQNLLGVEFVLDVVG